MCYICSKSNSPGIITSQALLAAFSKFFLRVDKPAGVFLFHVELGIRYDVQSDHLMEGDD